MLFKHKAKFTVISFVNIVNKIVVIVLYLVLYMLKSEYLYSDFIHNLETFYKSLSITVNDIPAFILSCVIC